MVAITSNFGTNRVSTTTGEYFFNIDLGGTADCTQITTFKRQPNQVIWLENHPNIYRTTSVEDLDADARLKQYAREASQEAHSLLVAENRWYTPLAPAVPELNHRYYLRPRGRSTRFSCINFRSRHAS